MRRKFSKHFIVKEDGRQAADLLAAATGLPKGRIKDAMQKGAVLLRRTGRKKQLRLRRASTEIIAGDGLTIHYDESVLAMRPLDAQLLADRRHYSVWIKPDGMLCQGTRFGDHTSLLRLAEIHFRSRRKVYLVHRLDRLAAGLVMIAHSPKAAALLSALFQQRKIGKEYRATVEGAPGVAGSKRTIDAPLDGREAITHLEVLSCDAAKDQSTLAVSIETGRLHQIRRHLAAIGHPIVGDPRYGNPASGGLQLAAVRLSFICPFAQEKTIFRLPAAGGLQEAGSGADVRPGTDGQNR